MVSDSADYCIEDTVFKYWDGVAPGYIHKIFKLHSVDIVQDHRWHWICLCGKQFSIKKLILVRGKNMVQNRP